MDGKESCEVDRGGSRYTDGIGGGAKFEVNMPNPTERCGVGECIGNRAGLKLRSIVSTSESEMLLCREVDRLLPRVCFSSVKGLRRAGDAHRDTVGVANGSGGRR
jgi:hypothetical protein